MQELLTTLRRLRAPGGCPWDREQTHESLRPYLLEEAAEAVDAVAEGPAELCSELGDVLLQVAFHSVIAEEHGTFSYAEIERGIVEKMVRRHPHVFGAHAPLAQASEVRGVWEQVKREERGGREKTLAEQLPSALGALERERQVQHKTGAVPGGRAALLQAVTQAPETAEGVAEVLAAAVAWARAAGVNPELALRDHTARALRAAEERSGNTDEATA
ncbi:MazG nucleotide pyrophosphohydrolase domain-containing protein [Deinococcus sp. Marseille-Q6407]|uniref:MazG nucleotide pyrophosphohydrolase domain-containing protein n=1 Tax=Deinococcus sp. Marseille-Q6407 TaxID=2969223 RepID=UPI0021BE7AAB|nr:MazG nucleotide pyrophosphohydrolase domain-containing protein [Deinococcus sp. Marseille-Q6407]